MTVYISPIGYDSTRITRPILSEGINDGDQIILLRPVGHGDDTRAQEAIEDIERMVNQVQPEVSVTKRTVPPDDFQAAVLECSALIRDIRDELIINFGGGPREVYLAVAIATLVHPGAVDKSLQFSDIDGSVEEISMPRIVGTPPGPTMETLKAIIQHGSEIGIPELANDLDKAKSTVSRHIRQLENVDAVKSEMHGKTKYVTPTFSGKLLCRRNIEETD
ncbi:CRISPR-associated DNA-binding Csa3 [Halorhabdus sp. SVX81]|uniref:CRISPR-associated CARF protein Csa3 n=1 Tax=Halorhabdus sp. SVX81 TaxID=2978283 RepID=UPI0023DBD6A0|nr:CRISPR-associated CARF protein Csa3 [Halorhabdus sp. SVX81]WEL18870.1 CRISPR-associated DNA-binding Csa3 [Halorhabdus sp. SVX81]